MRTFSVLFAIEIESRRVWVLGVTRNPNATGVTEKARNLSFDLAEAGRSFRFALRDRDCKYVARFDQVFTAEGTAVIRTPIQAPKANAFAERWVRSVRRQCLDWTLIWGRRHLEKVLAKVRRPRQSPAAPPRARPASAAWRREGACRVHLDRASTTARRPWRADP